MHRPVNRRKRHALAVVVMTPLVIALLFVTLVERPSWRFGSITGKERRAAVAIRDAESPFRQWGTKAFTLPYLEKYYASATYITDMPDANPLPDFVEGLQEALMEYETVDIFILAHANNYEAWIGAIDPALRMRIRLVYNSGCYNAASANAWLEAGASTVVAHPGESESPFFYFYFLRRWTMGDTLDSVVADSNQWMKWVVDWNARLPGSDFDAEELYHATEAQCFGQCTIGIGL